MLHRISEVRKSQKVTARTISRNLGISLKEVRQQENSCFDLRISDLQKWCGLLKVPISELIVETESGLSSPVKERSKMIRIMKLAIEIQNAKSLRSAKILSESLLSQITEIMPELEQMRHEK